MNSKAFYQWCSQTFVPVDASTPYLRKPLIMGVLNATPDSFSDGGFYLSLDKAYARAQAMIAMGADLIDIGGESTKPGALAVSCEAELERVIPLIERVRSVSDICISIDTSKALVMEAAITAGATWINDVKALMGEGSMAIAARMNVPVCLMHMQGSPQTMQEKPQYKQGVMDEIQSFFQQRIEACLTAGLRRECLILDPGFGFGKSVQHNLYILKCLRQLQVHGLPLLLGVSRKSTIGAVLQKTVLDRLSGSTAAAVFAAMQGVSIIRTHDVEETNQALTMLNAIISTNE